MQLEKNYSRKNEEEATTYERAYDVLIPSEASAGKALEVIKKSIQKTPPDNTSDLAVRLVMILAFLGALRRIMLWGPILYLFLYLHSLIRLF